MLLTWILPSRFVYGEPASAVAKPGNAVPGGQEARLSLTNNEAEDRFPLHAKVDFNNQSAPGTPELSLNASAVGSHLWNLDHSVGAQYSFSPAHLKEGHAWDFYDLPRVANYSAIYRMPLGRGDAEEENVAVKPGSFGYDEATRKFRLPPASSRADHTSLWGAGFGVAVSIGAVWEARLLCSWPLLSAGSAEAGEPRLDFSVSAWF